ncbi:MAG: hypothetical protein QNK20_14565 [Aureibaculum sp.]|nr:hypothetical protein [Aureibaculum sp.]
MNENQKKFEEYEEIVDTFKEVLELLTEAVKNLKRLDLNILYDNNDFYKELDGAPEEIQGDLECNLKEMEKVTKSMASYIYDKF